jgi:hypothetical protein
VSDRRAATHIRGEGELVELSALNAAVAAAPTPVADALESAGREPFGRFRRRFERIKGVPEPDAEPTSLGGEAELKLQLMLLREENARLKAARHQPPSPGNVIDRVRVLAVAKPDGDAVDDAWAVLNECLVIREGLDQMCAEIQSAINRVRDQLSALTLSIEDQARQGASGVDAANALPALTADRR